MTDYLIFVLVFLALLILLLLLWMFFDSKNYKRLKEWTEKILDSLVYVAP